MARLSIWLRETIKSTHLLTNTSILCFSSRGKVRYETINVVQDTPYIAVFLHYAVLYVDILVCCATLLNSLLDS